MMGHHCRAESLFYYFRLEDQVPENHLLRLIDRHVNFEFIRANTVSREAEEPDVVTRGWQDRRARSGNSCCSGRVLSVLFIKSKETGTNWNQCMNCVPSHSSHSGPSVNEIA
jgi:hypothetical protein